MLSQTRIARVNVSSSPNPETIKLSPENRGDKNVESPPGDTTNAAEYSELLITPAGESDRCSKNTVSVWEMFPGAGVMPTSGGYRSTTNDMLSAALVVHPRAETAESRTISTVSPCSQLSHTAMENESSAMWEKFIRFEPPQRLKERESSPWRIYTVAKVENVSGKSRNVVSAITKYAACWGQETITVVPGGGHCG